MRRLITLVALVLPLAGVAVAAPASAAGGFTVANGFASYQPGSGSTTPTPVQFNVLTLASGGTPDASTLSITGEPASGSASADTSSGIVTYSPTPSTAGTQTVTFQLCETGSTGCQTATLTEGPGTTVNNAFQIPLVGGYATYNDIAYGALAPASKGQGSGFTYSFAPTAITLPSTLTFSGHVATLNYLDGLNFIVPVPPNSTYVSGSARVEGGDAATTGHATVTLCNSIGGTNTCTATPSSSSFPTQTTTPYLELQLSSSVHIPGGSQVTVPSFVAQFKASGAAGSTIQSQVTEFDAGGNVTITGIVTNYNTTLSMYPTTPSFSGSGVPPFYVYPLSDTSITQPLLPPAVTGITPPSGPTAGSTSVTISGANLANATAVDFGAVAGTVTADAAGSITATSPAVSSPGTVDITVTTAGGTSTRNVSDQFTYLAPAPTISGISPGTGPETGGTVVTISGSNLEDATAVDFGLQPATVTTDLAGSIVAKSPPGTGTVDVTVTTASGTATSPTQFTYEVPPPPPSISGIAPASGSVAGGTSVTISGANLENATAVDFGAAAAAISSDSAASIVVTTPAGLGTVNVTVTTPGGTTSSPVQYVYTVPPGFPTVVAAAPTSGPAWGGTTVTVSGTNLSGATAVHFGTKAAFFSGVTDTSVTAVAPAGIGTAEITVTTPTGTSIGSAAGSFTYVTPAPTVGSLSPISGPGAGGNVVTIRGSNFFGLKAVHFGTANARIVGQGLTSASVIAPAGKGKVVVTVTTPGGVSVPASGANYSYAPPPAPAVTSISPASGAATGGTLVTVTGKNLTGLRGVYFGTRPAWFSQVSSTSFVAIAPAGSGNVDIEAITAGGRSATGSADRFAYSAAIPSITSLTPSSGPARGGTTVMIKGSNLTFATSVHFGTAAALVIGDSATSVQVRAPGGSGTVSVTVTTPAGTSKVNAAARFTYG